MSVASGAPQHVVVTAATALGAAPRRLVRSGCSTWGGDGERCRRSGRRRHLGRRCRRSGRRAWAGRAPRAVGGPLHYAGAMWYAGRGSERRR